MTCDDEIALAMMGGMFLPFAVFAGWLWWHLYAAEALRRAWQRVRR